MPFVVGLLCHVGEVLLEDIAVLNDGRQRVLVPHQCVERLLQVRVSVVWALCETAKTTRAVDASKPNCSERGLVLRMG